MTNILEIDPSDHRAVAALVDTLRSHCTPQECEQFLSRLYVWERSIPAEAKPVIDAYTRMTRRGGFVPAIVQRYLTVTADLMDTPVWREILHWQTYIASLPVLEREGVAA